MGKTDIGCKDIISVPLTCQSTFIEHMTVGMPVFQDACPDHQTTSNKVGLLDNVREPILTSGFSPDENTSRVTVQTESRLITEENLPPIVLFSGQVFSATGYMIFLVVHNQIYTDCSVLCIHVTCIKYLGNCYQ
ncbi:hypothetical protein TNCV_3021071 [Trichonephila clavipes]|nr:hypothetical protein TNCV_3021071 [Trichonephila clavipes]